MLVGLGVSLGDMKLVALQSSRRRVLLHERRDTCSLAVAILVDFVQRQPFHQEFPTANPHALDLLDRMLQFDPRQRISVDDALNHPYLASFRGDEPTAPSMPKSLIKLLDCSFHSLQIMSPVLRTYVLMLENLYVLPGWYEIIFSWRFEQRTLPPSYKSDVI